MSESNGTGQAGSHKRMLETADPSDAKRQKPESAAIPDDEATLDRVFDPLPFETRTDGSHLENSLNEDSKLELPDFLSEKPETGHYSPAPQPHESQSPIPSQGSSYHQQASHQTDGILSVHSLAPSLRSSVLYLAVADHHRLREQSRSPPNIPRVNSSLKMSETPSTGSVSGPLNHSQSALSLNSGSYPSSSGTQQATGRPTQNLASPYKVSMRFDSSRSFNVPSGSLNQQMSGYGVSMGSNSGVADKSKEEDPTKLNDALAAAGVDIQREEELLSSNYTRMPLNPLQQQQIAQRLRSGYAKSTPFLQPYHLAVFMNRVGRENGMVQNFMLDTEMLEFMSSACKEWISNLVAKTSTIARHRRRGIPVLSSTNGSGSSSKQKVVPSSQRSEVSKDLRELALRQKTLEERRVEKRALLGLERSGDVAPENGGKDGTDETLHRAANATAAMMTMNPGRKKYSWMTSGANGSARDEVNASAGKESGSKQSTLILSRGDNGLRFREIRTGNMITTRDLLTVLEDERIGTAKAIVKGYARLKD